MIEITQRRTTHIRVELTKEESKEVAMKYITEVVMGDGCYITQEGRLEHWTSYPNGSGTTTDMGEATPLQRAAWEFLTLSAKNPD